MDLYTKKPIGVKDTPCIEFTSSTSTKMIPVAGRSKAWICGLSLAGILCSNPAGGMSVFECCVVSGRGLCDGTFNRPDESYRVWCMSVIVKPRQ